MAAVAVPTEKVLTSNKATQQDSAAASTQGEESNTVVSKKRNVHCEDIEVQRDAGVSRSIRQVI